MSLAPKLAAAGNTHTKTFPPQPPSVLAAISKAMMSVRERETWHGGGVSNMYRIPWQGDNEMFRYTNCEIKPVLLYCYCLHTQIIFKEIS